MQHACTRSISHSAASRLARHHAGTAAETHMLHVTSGRGNCAFTEEAICQTHADIDRRPVPQVYEKLNAEGRFQEKLLEMYRWGKVNGWDAAPSAVQ